MGLQPTCGLQVSGKLFPFTKDERKAQAVRILKGIRLPRRDLYLPTNPESRVVSLVPESGQPMQSAAKVSNCALDRVCVSRTSAAWLVHQT